MRFFFKKNIKRKENSGFTLVELLLYVSIVSIVITAISSFLFVTFQSSQKTETLTEVEQQGFQIMQIITQTIRNSTAINSPATGTSASSLSLANSVSAQNPTVFDLNSGNIRITEGASAPVNLNSNKTSVTSLTFSNLSRTSTKGTIRIQLTLTRINPANRPEYRYTQTFYNTATIR